MRSVFCAAVLVVALWAHGATAQSTLSAIRQRGFLNCGTGSTTLGFSTPDAQGVFRGMDADLCRGIAAAVFGDPTKVRFINNSGSQRFVALQSGSIDVLFGTVTRNYTRDTGLGLIFASTYFYDGQGFIVAKKLNVDSAKQLDGASICLPPASDASAGASAYFRNHNMKFKAIEIETQQEIVSALEAGRCDAYSTDLSNLVAMKARSFKSGDDWVVLPDNISKSPFAPVVRQGDDQWLTLVRWVINSVIDAEELGISSKTALDPAVANDNVEVRRMRGSEGEAGKPFGLPNDWPARVIAAIGNYDELYARNLGPLGLPRGFNRNWQDGGLLLAPSFH